jgi:hypothetical protein
MLRHAHRQVIIRPHFTDTIQMGNPVLFLFAQALNEVQVGLVVLHAVIALRVLGVELETIGVGEDAAIRNDLGSKC